MTDQDPNDLHRMLDEIERPSQPVADTPAPRPGPEYQSPTVATLDAKRLPNPTPVCEACPHSMWFASATHLKCYCRAMHAVTWNSEEPTPILSRDGILLSSE